MDNHALLVNRLRLERNGAIASVALRVKDDRGNPIPQADVHLYFPLPTENDPGGRVKGQANPQGVFAATKKTTYECIWEVSKDGYHASSSSIKFSPYYSEQSPATGKLTAKPIEVDVIVKKRSDAQLLHGDRIWHDLVIPTNTWVGFDFIRCDSVAPYGQGQTAHVEFRLKSCRQLPSVNSGTHGYTNSFEIRTTGGRVEIFKEDETSHSPFMSPASTRKMKVKRECAMNKNDKSGEILNKQAQGTVSRRPPATVVWAAIIWILSIVLEFAWLVVIGAVDKDFAQSFGGGSPLWNSLPLVSAIAAILALAMPLALLFRVDLARRIALFLGAAVPLFVLVTGLFGMCAIGVFSDMVSKATCVLALLVLPAAPVWIVRPLLHSASAENWYFRQVEDIGRNTAF